MAGRRGGARRISGAEHVDPGVAQRTGATTYYVEVFPGRARRSAGAQPILSLLPCPAASTVDRLRAARGRADGAGRNRESRTARRSIASTGRTLTTAEKMSLGDGRFDVGPPGRGRARAQPRATRAFDMERAAREAGTIVSAVMFGAIAAAACCRSTATRVEAAIRARDARRRREPRGLRADCAATARTARVRSRASRHRRHAECRDCAPSTAFPPPARESSRSDRAARRVPGRAYAELYSQRLARMLAAEASR